MVDVIYKYSEAILAHATSDAKFDGYDWLSLSRVARERYLDRATAGFEAVAKVLNATDKN